MTTIDRPPTDRTDTVVSAPWPLREMALVGILALVLNLAGNGHISLWDRDEPRYAGCTREMRASGDWIHPTFNAEPRYHKPVLIYWLMLAGTALGGDNPFGARLISGLAGAGTCLLTWAWGRRMLGPRAGLLAGLILATSPIVMAESKMATTDATLMFWVVGCQFALWRLAQGSSWRAAAVFWTFLGLAILTKSPAAPVLIAVSGVASWWWRGPTACWKRLHWRWGPLLCAAIVAPWNIAILLRSHGAYYHVAVGYHIIRRMTNGIEEHGGFPGYYVVFGLLTCFPWSPLLPAAVVAGWQRRKESSDFGFLLGWIIGPLVFLECVRTKLIHYYLPCFPAWALLIAWFLTAAARSEAHLPLSRWPLGRMALRWLSAIAIGAIVVFVAIPVSGIVPPELRWPCLTLATVMALGALATCVQFNTGHIDRAAKAMIATSALCSFLAGAWLLPAAEPFRISGIVGRRLAVLETRERARPVLYTYQLPGVVYALGHPAPIVRGRLELVEQVNREGRVVTALLPEELKGLRKKTTLAFDVCETVKGFNLDKGRNDTLHLVVARHGQSAVATRPGPASVE